jgi:predicted anti-sigma-YlaC factor YlaD
MRCRDARQWLYAQRDGVFEEAKAGKANVVRPEAGSPEALELQEHLAQCPVCRAKQQQLRHLDDIFCPSTPPMRTSISTDKIMLAIQQQQRVTQQLEDIRKQQQSRVAQMRNAGTALAAIAIFTLSSIPLLLLAVAIIQIDLVVKALAPLSGVIDVLIIVGEYLQTGVALVSRDNWLLSGVAFVVVVMMGMWLRLMRHPQEA